MFTGIIEDLGVIKRMDTAGEGKAAVIETGMDLSGTAVGDSIAVNGACFTVVELGNHMFKVDMAPETISRTIFKNASAGMKVNIEKALRLSDRLDGHLVSGHVDGTGVMAAKFTKSNAVIVTITAPEKLTAEMIEKGSVAVDGISLTVNRCDDREFEVSIIPHTARITTIGMKERGDEVNIETDMIGKYVRKFLDRDRGENRNTAGKSDISMAFLAGKGFL